MRIIGYSKKWDKLNLELPVEERPDFTTFRFEHKSQPYEIGQLAQQVYKPRRKGGGELLGIAEIVGKEIKLTGEWDADVTDEEAQADGFRDMGDMEKWMIKAYGTHRVNNEPMYKLTLKWIGVRG